MVFFGSSWDRPGDADDADGSTTDPHATPAERWAHTQRCLVDGENGLLFVDAAIDVPGADIDLEDPPTAAIWAAEGDVVDVEGQL